MNSEKVKEIKKGLEDNANYEHYNKLGYIDGYKCKTVAYADILTYINELESENAYQKEHIEMWFRKNEEKKKLIYELEKKNARLLDSVETVQNNRCVYKCELAKKQLKQFAERLKAKMPCEEIFKGVWDKIDETLKEYGNDTI